MGSGGHPDRPRPNYSGADYSFNGKILLAAVIVLFVVVLLVVLLHLYARWFWRVTGGLSSRRRGISRRRRFSFGREDPFRLRTAGLDPSVVENLPSFVYKSEDFGDGPLECAVCLCELEENEKGRLLPKCNHSFHIECIDMWFHSHSTCPLCRGSVHPDSPSNVAESGSVQQISGDNSSAEEPIPANRSIGAEIEGNLVESGQTSSDAVWGVRKQMNNVEQPAAASSSRSFPQLAIDMPKRPDGFSSHREDQVYSPNEQSSKSPVARLRSFKRMLSRGKDRKVFPSAPDEGDIEKNDQSQS